MQFIFWQNIVSPHQGSFLRALRGAGHEVTVVVPELMSVELLAVGWKAPDLGDVKIVLAPNAAEIRQLIESGSQQTIHVLAGARWTLLGNEATRWCRTLRRRMGVLTEAPDPRGLRGLARRAKYTAERFTMGRHYEFILAMGEMGVRWFGQCGYLSARLFPFAYVTEEQPDFGIESRPGPVRLLFVGRLVALKGLDVLFRALACQSTQSWELQVIGNGPEDESLRALALELGIGNRVEWVGKLPIEEIPERMARSDVMVLPSHKDGWGAVVNEALMVGTPVICSTACGAAELLREPWLGAVFKAGSVEGLATALGHWTAAGPRTPAERQRIREWSRCISGERVSDYFLAIMEHVFNGAPRPTAPWRM